MKKIIFYDIRIKLLILSVAHIKKENHYAKFVTIMYNFIYYSYIKYKLYFEVIVIILSIIYINN